MQTLLSIFQILLSMALILVVLLQQRSVGLSATFGGQGGFHVAKRGAEKVLFNITLVISILFVINSMAFLFI